MTQLPPSITIRVATPDDELDVRRLAALDGAPEPPAGRVLLAEVDGRLRAALTLADGTVIADPFVLSEETVRLLRLRAAAIAGPAAGGRVRAAFGSLLASVTAPRGRPATR